MPNPAVAKEHNSPEDHSAEIDIQTSNSPLTFEMKPEQLQSINQSLHTLADIKRSLKLLHQLHDESDQNDSLRGEILCYIGRIQKEIGDQAGLEETRKTSLKLFDSLESKEIRALFSTLTPLFREPTAQAEVVKTLEKNLKELKELPDTVQEDTREWRDWRESRYRHDQYERQHRAWEREMRRYRSRTSSSSFSSSYSGGFSSSFGEPPPPPSPPREVPRPRHEPVRKETNPNKFKFKTLGEISACLKECGELSLAEEAAEAINDSHYRQNALTDLTKDSSTNFDFPELKTLDKPDDFLDQLVISNESSKAEALSVLTLWTESLNKDDPATREKAFSNLKNLGATHLKKTVYQYAALGLTHYCSQKGSTLKHPQPDTGLLIRNLSQFEGKDLRTLLVDLSVCASPADIENTIGALPEGERVKTRAVLNHQAVLYDADFYRAKPHSLAQHTTMALQIALANTAEKDKSLVDTLVNTCLAMNNKQGQDILLGAGRWLVNNSQDNNPHFSRIMEGLAAVNSFRSNELIAEATRIPELDPQKALKLLEQLRDNDYLDKSALRWLELRHDNRKAELEKPRPAWKSALKAAGRISFLWRGRQPTAQQLMQQQRDLDTNALCHVMGRGLLPCREVMDFLVGKEASSTEIVDQRLDELKAMSEEFARTENSEELITLLNSGERKSLAFYLLENGKIKFRLINNYSFGKFADVISIADSLAVHDGPLEEFFQSLRQAGHDSETAKAIIDNLRQGHHPFHKNGNPQDGKLIRLDVSNSALLEEESKKIGAVFGSGQLGVFFKSVCYRGYLKEREEAEDQEDFNRLVRATTFEDRLSVISGIEETHQDFTDRLIAEFEQDWNKTMEKFGLDCGFGEMLSNAANSVDVETMIDAIEERRITLRRAKEQLLLALKGVNPQAQRVSREIQSKKRALGNLEKGLQHKPELQGRIDEIREEIDALEFESQQIGSNPLTERYQNVPAEERDQLIKTEAEEIRVLAEKDPSAVLTYFIVELLGEDRLLESDVELAKEIASHLEGPLDTVKSLMHLDQTGQAQADRREVVVRMLDKKRDLMTMARFADSKICCYSSSNYEMRVAHSTPNKYWLASKIRDPLSFVYVIEEPQEDESQALNNLGFIMGSYGISRDGLPTVDLNGVYLSTGNAGKSVASVLAAIEQDLSGTSRLMAQYQNSGGIHGGKIDRPLGYEQYALEIKRLKALKGSDGEPETRTYDDLGKWVNQWHNLSGYHKKLRT